MSNVVYVVEDTEEHLVTYTPTGAPFGFLAGSFPTANGRHPWASGARKWEGHGTLSIQRPGDDYAVWLFWQGTARTFGFWYLNIQESFRRTLIGFDTQDLELDVIVRPDWSWELKDDDLLDATVERGRYTGEQVAQIRKLGDELTAMLDARQTWWDESWTTWQPDSAWEPVPLPPKWETVPPAAPAGAITP